MVDEKKEYPFCEIMVRYDCHLCKDKHVAVIKAKRGIDIDARKGYMEMAKRDCVFEFFRQHPKEEAKSFDLNKLSGVEVLCYAEDEEEREEIGISMIKEDVIAWRKEFFGETEKASEEAAKEKKNDETKLSIEEIEKLAPIETGIKEGMDFLGVETMVKKRLKHLEEREKQLSAELLLVQNERKQFKELADAAEKVREIRNPREEK